MRGREHRESFLRECKPVQHPFSSLLLLRLRSRRSSLFSIGSLSNLHTTSSIKTTQKQLMVRRRSSIPRSLAVAVLISSSSDSSLCARRASYRRDLPSLRYAQGRKATFWHCLFSDSSVSSAKEAEDVSCLKRTSSFSAVDCAARYAFLAAEALRIFCSKN